MSVRTFPHVLRGRLTDAEKERIVELAGRKLNAGRIALKLNRHPGTINYAMHRLGLRKLTRRTFEYRRGNVVVRSFSDAEDARITYLRTNGETTVRIAQLVSEEFGHRRTPHAINIRLVMLACDAEAA